MNSQRKRFPAGQGSMHFLAWIRIVAFLLLIQPAGTSGQTAATSPRIDIKVHTAGNIRRVVANGAIFPWTYRGPVCEYPPGAGLENMIAGSPVLELAAAIQDHDSLQYRYTQWWSPGRESWDTIWAVRDFDSVSIPFWPSYAGLADEDFVFQCRDEESHTERLQCPDGSKPLDLTLLPLHVTMNVSNMTWSVPPLNDVLLTRYRIVPERYGLSNLFLSLYFRGGIGLPTVSWRDNDDRSLYLPDQHLTVVTDGGLVDGVQSKNCVGYRIFLPRTISPAGLRWTTKDDFSRQSALQCVKSPSEYAAVMHGLLSSRVQMSGPMYGSNWIAVGPLEIPLGDSLEIWTAEILGQSVGDVLSKSSTLDLLAQKDFVTPRAPPAPPLRIERADKSITLQWDARTGDVDPETYKDPGRWDRMETPFEGYRVYRSTQSLEGPWTMMFECDIAPNGFAYDFGLQHRYTETGLLNHAEYYYAVTAFSKPDTVTGFASRESRLQRTMQSVTPGLPARPRVGDVAVVPNPYRSDIAYDAYDPPWERPSGAWPTWTETDRRIQFINLPRSCTITIYTLAGDRVDLIRHEDPAISFHDWNLTSYVGQAVASGLYLFTVEDRETGDVQLGKFVIIR